MNRSVAFVPVLLALLLLVPVASAAYTGPWGITLRDNLGKPNDTSQGLDGGANFTIQIWVGSTSVGSARYLVIPSSATNASVPLMRRPLGYFDANYNSTRLINVSVSLSSYSSVINPHGDYLHIWVERLGGALEAAASLSASSWARSAAPMWSSMYALSQESMAVRVALDILAALVPFLSMSRAEKTPMKTTSRARAMM